MEIGTLFLKVIRRVLSLFQN